jgi:cation diffusion facilitator family transporter
MSDKALVQKLAFWSIPLAVGVMGLKLVAWYVTGSVALFSDALESTVNIIAAVIAFYVIRYAQKPADEDHQYGHHKAEYVSAVVEGVLIIVAALLIVQEAWGALFEPRLPDAPLLGLLINALAGAINLFWAALLIRVGKKHRSPALHADGQHIMSDVVTSGGVLIGLVLAIVTGYAILDPLMAIFVAANILYQGYKVISHSIGGLMDRALEPDEIEAVRKVIADNAQGVLGVHDLRTRQAGSVAFVAFHIVVPADMSVGKAHDICDRMEDAIKAILPGASLAVHVEPESERAHGLRVEVQNKVE